MYTPNKFKELDQQKMLEFIREYSLGVLVSNNKNGLNAEHIPFVLSEGFDRKIVLKAHIARANPLWQELDNGAPVLVIFHGSNSYISPNWYPSKKNNKKVVPTWNYAAVHAQGKIKFINDPKWILALLNELTDIHEKNQLQPWAVNDAPVDFIEKQLRAIVGIEIEVDDLIAKFKLSQNQTAENRNGVKSALEALEHSMTDLIKR